MTAITGRTPPKPPGAHRRCPKPVPLPRRVLRELAGRSFRRSLPLSGTVAITGAQDGYMPGVITGLVLLVAATVAGVWL